jgi:hypothetical protein
MTSLQSSLKAVSSLGNGPKLHAPLAQAAPFAEVADAGCGAAVVPRKLGRRRIWDLSSHYHCSIVGTCLSTAELRKLLVKLGMASSGDSEHDLHGRGVGLASRQDAAGKLLNKALDDRHLGCVKRYGRANTELGLQALWQEDVKAGDIAGGYWALMTHPAAGPGLVREAFGYVHMLSHLVGAANRADIRRLQQLEELNAALNEKIERQQAQIRDITVARDATIRQLQRDLADRIAGDMAAKPLGAPPPGRESSLDSLIASLRRQLEAESRGRLAAEERLSRAQAVAAQARAAAVEAQGRAAALQAEIDAVERSLKTAAEAAPAPMALDGLTVLYVGGRPTQMPHIRQAAAERGGKLLHHDGGIEDNGLILASMVSRADIIFFPVDCVSHGAVGTVKRTCRSEGKKYVPLRSAAVTSFIAGLCA